MQLRPWPWFYYQEGVYETHEWEPVRRGKGWSDVVAMSGEIELVSGVAGWATCCDS